MSEAMPPPPGGDTNSGPAINAVTGTLLGIAVLFVVIRCYVRLMMSRNFGWDDGIIVMTLVFLIASDIFIFKIVHLGTGRHLHYLHEPKVAEAQVVRWNTYYQVLNVIGAFTTKLSISLFLLRIKRDRVFKYVVIAVITSLGIVSVIAVASITTQCTPLEKLWNPSIKGHCISSNFFHVTTYVQSGFSIIADLFLTISPIVILWNVRISIRKKIAICGLMSLGLMATVANALRNAYIPTLSASDLTHDLVPILLVAILEFSLGVIASCLPTYMPLFKKVQLRKIQDKLSGRSSAPTSASHGWEFSPHSKNGTNPLSLSGAHTISHAKYERQNSSESDVPLRGMDRAISYKKTYTVSTNITAGDVESGRRPRY